MISNQYTEIHVSPEDRLSVPAWFAEVVIVIQHLATKGLLDAFAHEVRLVRGRFGTYEPIDFLALLLGYVISGERTLADFFERLAPFGSAFFWYKLANIRHGTLHSTVRVSFNAKIQIIWLFESSSQSVLLACSTPREAPIWVITCISS